MNVTSQIKMRCMIKVDVDIRGPIWVAGIIRQKLADNGMIKGQFVITSEDHLYHVDPKEVFINAKDLKESVDANLHSLF
jgi:hypothetical protein